jgi:hypothetical protein
MSDTAQFISPFPEPPSQNIGTVTIAPPHPQPINNDDQLYTPPVMTGSFHKESAPVPQIPVESAPLVEIQEHEAIPEEVEGWLQKLDAAGEIKLPEPITHDGDVMLSSSDAQVVKEKIILPMTQAGMQQGLTAKVTDSARWLAEWCVRINKMMKGSAKYAPESNHG